jgi:hypothetical protein
VVGALAERAVIVLGEVEQFPPHVEAGETEEVGGVGGLDLGERPQQAQGGPLEQVVGLLPAVNAWEVAEHLAGQVHHALVGTVDELAAGGLVAGSQAVDPCLDLSGLAAWLGHRNGSLLSEPRRPIIV